ALVGEFRSREVPGLGRGGGARPRASRRHHPTHDLLQPPGGVRARQRRLAIRERAADRSAARGAARLSRVSRVAIRPGRPLRGETTLPGDKSITQRAILLGALAPGVTRIRGANPGADARAALGIARALGVPVRRSAGEIVLRGGTLREPDGILDARNSGTALRLATGLLAAQPIFAILTGDAS